MSRSSRTLVAIGVVLLILAAAMPALARATLVRYPGGSLDKTAHATGSLTLFVNPASAAPQPPQTFPLDIERRLYKVETTGGNVLMQEDDQEKIGPLPPQVFAQRYVLDARSVKDVGSTQAYAYTPDTPVDRSPAYSINFPFSTGHGPYPVWKNEVGRAYDFTSQGAVTVSGLRLRRFHGYLADAAVRPYYLPQLKPQGIPASLTLDQLKPQLTAGGVNVGLLTSVLAQLDPGDRTTIDNLLAAPIPLDYRLVVDTSLLVEPRSGAIVSLDRILQTISVRPNVSGLGRIQAILGQSKYTPNPAVTEGAAVLARLVAKPPTTKVFTVSYSQTPSSIADIASFTKVKAAKITLVTRTMPVIIALLGLLVLGLWLMLILAGRRHKPAGPGGAAPVITKPAGRAPIRGSA